MSDSKKGVEGEQDRADRWVPLVGDNGGEVDAVATRGRVEMAGKAGLQHAWKWGQVDWARAGEMVWAKGNSAQTIS